MLLGILAVVTAGSLLAALTSSLPLLVLARVLQGSSYALFPLSIGVLRDELPPARLTGAMAVVSATLGAGGGFGLVLTGLLTRGGGDYHRVFFLAAAVTALALALAWFVVPGRTPSARAAWTGSAPRCSASASSCCCCRCPRGTSGAGAPLTLGCFAGAAVVVAGWLGLERRVATPLVAPELLRSRPC